ncbi:YitT family protein [Paenibacillus filicis]|uniref:YitT family protein n=1 Tax=Paenibacillus gyeongsangnamensis TaxID=3388067 RepID=A0ABT4QEY2_9BACL|nr:YitT family protein [Paenibacillus filicis]MCZ8515439.1 YitT family protein [Paenibacillus filicis]
MPKFNLPLFILAYLYFRPLFYKSVISIIVLSLVVGFLQDLVIPYGIHNFGIGSIFGGFWMGLSLGILTRLNASLGSGSLLGKMLINAMDTPLANQSSSLIPRFIFLAFLHDLNYIIQHSEHED